MAFKEKQRVCVTKTSLFLLIISVIQVSCDYYTSIAGLEDLLDSELYLIETYENYLNKIQRTNQRIKSFLDDVEEIILENEENAENYYYDPLNAFKIIRRIVVDWKTMEQVVLLDSDSEEFSANITQMTDLGYANATAEDLIGASVGLARLQKTYALSSIDIADGILMNYEYDTRLSAHDCYELGRNLYEAKNFNYSVDWLLQAQILFDLQREELEEINEDHKKMTPDFPYLFDVDILEYLASSMFNVGNYKMAKILNDELLAKEPDNPNGLQFKELFETHIRAERSSLLELHKPKPQFSESYHVDELTEAVCRGSLHQTPAEQRNLRCRYFNNNIPFCLIAPFKMEELSKDPFVAVYHDTIYENEMDGIIKRAQDIVERSKVGDTEMFSDIRISKTAWLYNDKNRLFLKTLRRRFQDITGLNLDYAEELQVVNYGIGGHYGPHYDFAEDPDVSFPGQGNRILTALFYINDVELGGATAFPFLRLAVPPKRGSAVIWHNLHESLELDYRTKHSGCPVLKGSKWICNEWFHQVGQEFTRPCSLERNGHISLPFKYMQ